MLNWKLNSRTAFLVKARPGVSCEASEASKWMHCKNICFKVQNYFSLKTSVKLKNSNECITKNWWEKNWKTKDSQFPKVTCNMCYCSTYVDRCARKIWSFNKVKTENWKLACTYTRTISVNKELFQFAGKKNIPDFLPNGIAGTVFGQGLPPVKVNWKKNGRNWQRQAKDFLIGAIKSVITRWILF